MIDLFDIPEVQHAVFGRHYPRQTPLFSHRELISYMTVSRPWHCMLLPFFWQRVVIKTLDQDGCLLKPESAGGPDLPTQESVLAHLHLVREFECDHDLVLEWVAKSGKCQNLRSLKCWNLTMGTNTSCPWMDFVTLLNLNKNGIRVLGVSGPAFDYEPLDGDVLEALSDFFSIADENSGKGMLQELSLYNLDLDTLDTLEAFKGLVNHNPSLWSFQINSCCLQKTLLDDIRGGLLNLGVLTLNRNDNMIPRQVRRLLEAIAPVGPSLSTTSESPPTISSPLTPRFSATPSSVAAFQRGLVELGLSLGNDSLSLQPTLQKLIKQYPNLATLRLTKSDEDPPEGTVLTILKALVSPLTRLFVDYLSFSEPTSIVDYMIYSKLRTSLTTLVLGSSTAIKSRDVLEILNNFENLETLKVEIDSFSFTDRTCCLNLRDMQQWTSLFSFNSVTAATSAPRSPVSSTTWACARSLKYLTLAIDVKDLMVPGKDFENSSEGLGKLSYGLQLYFEQLSKMAQLETVETILSVGNLLPDSYHQSWKPVAESWRLLKTCRKIRRMRMRMSTLNIPEYCKDLMREIAREQWSFAWITV